MMGRRSRIFGWAAAALLVAGCGSSGTGAAPQVGERVPEYAAKTLEGEPVSLSTLRGHPVLVNVWATWCKPCEEEMPDLQRIYAANAPKGLRMVGVSIDERGQEAAVRDFAREYGVTYDLWHDPGQAALSTFGAMGVPNTYLIGRDGTLLWKKLGPVKEDDPALEAALQKALAPG